MLGKVNTRFYSEEMFFVMQKLAQSAARLQALLCCTHFDLLHDLLF